MAVPWPRGHGVPTPPASCLHVLQASSQAQRWSVGLGPWLQGPAGVAAEALSVRRAREPTPVLVDGGLALCRGGRGPRHSLRQETRRRRRPGGLLLSPCRTCLHRTPLQKRQPGELRGLRVIA